MKTIGLLGGMSWESTQHYYRLINQGVKQQLGGLHSAPIAMFSVDFAPIETLQHLGDWDSLARILIDAARRVQAAGADGLMICTNTMHKLAPQIEAAIDIPLLHIADATGKHIQQLGYQQVALLGTAFTMEHAFYKQRLVDNFGLSVMVPDTLKRALVHKVIYDELCQGQINPKSKQQYLQIIDQLAADGAEAVILGCTEIGLLVQQQDRSTPLLDTTAIHAASAVDFILS
ncbi:aspartate/glutamate racemase family protein [Shewanella avicenniae]|uniref:Aspartate/glutamate racemase family protein n=1 Tax=Shewanella avicenniae TaxID=2814294 RepID=A0ABX7QLA4_9GAMM|nr:aspartate/glutamate racemase family protein [Shewanella avicenniae]QSX32234.1 aspartate/glutamate racemase family protein [Shewanella avicenniae]